MRVSVAALLEPCYARTNGLLRPRRGAALAMLAVLALMLGAVLFGSALAHAFDAQRLALAAQALGPRAVAAVGPLQQLIAQGSRATDDSRVRATNQFFNDAIQFVDDPEIWGMSDYWASPLQALGKGMGDCEDYSLAKYFSLVSMGMPLAKLRLVYVRAQISGQSQAHMVLAYYPAPGSEPLILDNLVSDVRPASQRPDLEPVFSFNSEGLWHGVSGATAGDPSSRLSKWRDVLARARAEGF
jgi:predicted transglutaminase-like cysteine proteinase